jgi:hypothetical protein
MPISTRILGLTLLLTTWSVYAGEVKVFPGINVDINEYKTFQWLPPKVRTKTGIVEDHPANQVLKDVIVRQLVQRGLTELADGGDLQIQALVLTESVPQLEAVIFTGMAMLPGDYMMVGEPIATVGRYNRMGSLYINMIDWRAKKSAWFGMATEGLPNGTMKPEEVRSKLDKAATNIFKKYPVKKK